MFRMFPGHVTYKVTTMTEPFPAHTASMCGHDTFARGGMPGQVTLLLERLVTITAHVALLTNRRVQQFVRPQVTGLGELLQADIALEFVFVRAVDLGVAGQAALVAK